MLKKLPLLILLLLIVCICATAQTITGTVTDATSKETMPFVTVSVEGTTNATTTDINGKFTLTNVKTDDVLLFSFVGYTFQKVKVAGQQTITVKMQSASKELGEVVVTALGVTRQKRELGYSTEKIKGDEINKSNSPNLLNAITGKAAGVIISNPDGVDGGTTRIRIRGNNSINGNNSPLIVVDGVPMQNTAGMTDIGRGQDWGSAINNINMNDVESVDILKGGAATALYGARGGNGAILITMKKGRKLKGLGLSYNSSFKTIHPYRYRDVQNKYGGGAPAADLSAPQFTIGADGIALFPGLGTDAKFGYPGSSVSWGPAFDDRQVTWWDGSIRNWSAQPENLKIPYKDGNNFIHNISFEGASDFGSMRVSITRTDNTPIVHNSNFNQTTVNTNTTLNITDKMKLSLSSSYIDYNRLNTFFLGEDGNAITKAILYSYPRSYQGEDLEHYELPNGTQNPQDGFPYLYISKHLWWNYYNNNTTLDRTKLLGGITLDYSITPWLTLMGRTGIDLTNDEYKTKHKPIDLIGLTDGFYGENNVRDRSFNNEFLLTATKKNIFKSNFSVSANAGAASWDRNMEGTSAHSGKWYYPNWYNLQNFTPYEYGTDSAGNTIVVTTGDNASELAPRKTFNRERINSLYSFINISFKDYVYLEITGRNDWTSTLPDDANSYFYPGASLSFVATDAIKKLKTKKLNFVKIRAGVAQTATGTSPYSTDFYYTTQIYGGSQASTFPNTIPPAALKPQRVNDFEVGTNLGFFDDRITLDFTYYYKYSFDQILQLPVAVSSGAPNVRINDGVLSNRGIELILNTTVLQKQNVTFKTGLNFTRNRNFVENLGGDAFTYEIGNIWGNNGPKMVLQEGDEYGTIVGWDYVYKDGKRVVNADGTEYLKTPTQVKIGNASAKFFAGWTTSLSYKNFTLNTLVDTKWGGDMYAGSYVIGLQTGQSPETLKERDGGGLPYTDANGVTSNTGVILEGVHEDGTPNTTVVHYYYKYLPNAGGWGNFLSKPGIVENTWVKLREVSLTYTLPDKFISKTKVFQGLSVVFTARDIIYLYTTVPDNINPEGYLGAGDAQGFEWGALPGTRSFSFGLNARF